MTEISYFVNQNSFNSRGAPVKRLDALELVKQGTHRIMARKKGFIASDVTALFLKGALYPENVVLSKQSTTKCKVCSIPTQRPNGICILCRDLCTGVQLVEKKDDPIRTCQSCYRPTINRFNCPSCLSGKYEDPN